MIREVFMPALSSTMTEGKIVSWSKAPGDKVEKGETVLVVESDKADMDVESFYEGYLAAIAVPAGEAAPVGSTLGLIAETEAEIAQAQEKMKGAAASPATPAVAPAPTPEPVAAVSAFNGSAAAEAPVVATGRMAASPRARKLAKQFKVELNTVKGSGPFGRIVAADIEVAAGKTPTPPIAQGVVAL
jgi:pyruvate dehydrogenase E2 component (dihydrolipoamide acetyltransferase)